MAPETCVCASFSWKCEVRVWRGRKGGGDTHCSITSFVTSFVTSKIFVMSYEPVTSFVGSEHLHNGEGTWFQ